MKYMGSKNRHANEIIKFFDPDKIYIEPFVGGANVIDKVENKVRIGYDCDEDLIELLRSASEGWVPPSIFLEEDYHTMRKNPKSPIKGYAAFALSYSGKKWGGWCRDSLGKRNYVKEAYDNALKQFPNLRGIIFECKDYKNIEIPKGSVVYCDPPYANTTKYKDKFNHAEFWQWVREISKDNEVFVSEYCAPDDFKVIWSKEVNSSLTKETGSKKAVEKLFKLKNMARSELGIK